MKSVVVTKIRFSKHCISISGIYDGEGFEAMLYRHSDHSWHPDPETRKLDPKLVRRLSSLVMRSLCQKRKQRRKHRVNDRWFAEDIRERYGL